MASAFKWRLTENLFSYLTDVSGDTPVINSGYTTDKESVISDKVIRQFGSEQAYAAQFKRMTDIIATNPSTSGITLLNYSYYYDMNDNSCGFLNGSVGDRGATGLRGEKGEKGDSGRDGRGVSDVMFYPLPNNAGTRVTFYFTDGTSVSFDVLNGQVGGTMNIDYNYLLSGLTNMGLPEQIINNIETDLFPELQEYFDQIFAGALADINRIKNSLSGVTGDIGRLYFYVDYLSGQTGTLAQYYNAQQKALITIDQLLSAVSGVAYTNMSRIDALNSGVTRVGQEMNVMSGYIRNYVEEIRIIDEATCAFTRDISQIQQTARYIEHTVEHISGNVRDLSDQMQTASSMTTTILHQVDGVITDISVLNQTCSTLTSDIMHVSGEVRNASQIAQNAYGVAIQASQEICGVTTDIAQLSVSYSAITSTVRHLSGDVENMSSIVQTASSITTTLTSRVNDMYFDMTQISLTSSSITEQVLQVSGEIRDLSTVVQTASSITNSIIHEVSGITTDMSVLRQTYSSLTSDIMQVSGEIRNVSQVAQTASTFTVNLSHEVCGITTDVTALRMSYSSITSDISQVSGEIRNASQILQTASSLTATLSHEVCGITTDIAALRISYSGLSSDITNVSGEIRSTSQIAQSAKDIALRAEQKGNSANTVCASLVVAYSGITTQVQQVSGEVINISQIAQTASGIAMQASHEVCGVTTDIAALRMSYSSLTSTIGYLSGDVVTYSEIMQVATAITASVYDGLERTGIDIRNGIIDINADTTNFHGSIKLFDADEGLMLFNDDNQVAVDIKNTSIGSFGALQNTTVEYQARAYTQTYVMGDMSSTTSRIYLSTYDTSYPNSWTTEINNHSSNPLIFRLGRASTGNVLDFKNIKYTIRGDKNNGWTGTLSQYKYKFQLYWLNSDHVVLDTGWVTPSSRNSNGEYIIPNQTYTVTSAGSGYDWTVVIYFKGPNSTISGTQNKRMTFEGKFTMDKTVSINTKIGTDGMYSVSPHGEFWCSEDNIGMYYNVDGCTWSIRKNNHTYTYTVNAYGMYGTDKKIVGHSVTPIGGGKAFGKTTTTLSQWDNYGCLSIEGSTADEIHNRVNGVAGWTWDARGFEGSGSNGHNFFNYTAGYYQDDPQGWPHPKVIFVSSVHPDHQTIPHVILLQRSDVSTDWTDDLYAPAGQEVYIYNHTSKTVYVVADYQSGAPTQSMYIDGDLTIKKYVSVTSHEYGHFVCLGGGKWLATIFTASYNPNS